MTFKKYRKGKKKGKKNPKLEYRKYRVRGHIRSFRDLEIYKRTTTLAAQINEVAGDLPQNLKGRSELQKEIRATAEAGRYIPTLIAEAYGDKYTDDELAYQKLERAMRGTRHVTASLDFLIESIDHDETKQELARIIRHYQKQGRKVLNLKRAWQRAAKKYKQNQ